MADLKCKFDWQLHNSKIGDEFDLENINKPLDGAYLADFSIDIRVCSGLETFFQTFE